MRAEAAPSLPARAEAYQALARLYTGPLPSPERALEAWIEALVSDPSSLSARAALRDHAATAHDAGPLNEALMRLGERPRDADDATELAATVERVRSSPGDRPALLALERVCRRTGDPSPLEAALRERIAQAGLPRVEMVRARLELSAIARRGGDEAAALDEVRALLKEAPGHRGAACTTLLLATRVGQPHDRADALVQLAGPVWPALRATLLAVAAPLYTQSGAMESARNAASQACEADPTCTRAVTALAAASSDGATDRAFATALERAMAVVPPRSDLCARLATAFDALGEPDLALGWTQRRLALRPGSREAMSDLLKRAMALRETPRLTEALGWVLAQPKPLGDLTEAIVAALDVLAELDRSKVRPFARRALDVLGPRVPILRARLLSLSERTSDPGLSIAVLERYVAAEGLGQFAGELLLELCERRSAAGDFDGAAHELARACDAGADAATVLERADALDAALHEVEGSLGSDGRIALVEARATALVVLARAEIVPPPRDDLGGPDPALGSLRGIAANAWRDLGSLRWDLAEDRRGAEDAFFRAGEISPRGGVERYARDLFAFAGAEWAIEALASRANRARGDDAHRARASLLIEAANLANAQGFAEHALVAASSAIESDPSRADAVALVERNAHVEGGLPILDRTYDLLAAAAMGRFGRRAAHYRGARQMERRGAIDLALKHAAACFESVPGEGTAYVLLTRLAERAADPSEAVRAMERVAMSGTVGDRAAWLKRAAALAGRTEEGARTRLDLLLRALNIRPEPSTVDRVGAAIDEVIGLGGEPDEVTMRFERAVKSSLPKLDGPDGSRAAVEMTRLAVRLGAFDVAFAALSRAMSADGDIDEYMELAPLVPQLAVEAGRVWVESVLVAAEKPYSSVGTALLRFSSKLSHAIGDQRLSVALLVHAAKRADEDEALVDEADLAVAALGDPALTSSLDAAISPERRAMGQVSLAEKFEREGDDDRAIVLLSRATTSSRLSREAQLRAAASLRTLLHQGGRISDADGLIRLELAKPDLPPSLRARAARELATSLARRGDPEAALDVLVAEATKGALEEGLFQDLRDLGRAASPPRRAAALVAAADLAPVLPLRLSLLREAAELAAEIGDDEGVAAHEAAISALDPAGAGALEAQEQAANERGDHAAIAALLATRIAGAQTDDRRRMLRLRRAAVLEQRLRDLPAAAAELEALLADAPDDVSALRFLADVKERLGDTAGAGLLLHRLSELSATSDEKADYGLRAATAYLASGDITTAEQILETVAPIAERESVLEVRVELARRRGDGRALSDALDRLSTSSRAPSEQRAAILLDAARAASAIGDDTAALERARRAAKLVPTSPDAVLEARRLEYRAFGTGTPREAQSAVEELGRIAGRLEAAHVELHVFLLAEELDVIQGGGAGMRELSRRHAEVGPLPLIALGMAERLVRGKNFDAALPLFDLALAGDLQGVRPRGRVAIAAAEAAASALDHDAAARLLAIAAGEPETRVVAQRRQLELQAAAGEPEAARVALEALIKQSAGVDRARTLLALGRLLLPTDLEAAGRALTEAASLAEADKGLAAQIAEAIARLATQEPAAPPPPADPAASIADKLARPAIRAVIASPRARVPETPTITAAPLPVAPPPLPVAPPPLPVVPPPLPATAPLSRGSSRYAPDPHDATSEEGALLRDLQAGSFDAGERLIALYGARTTERTHDALMVRRYQASLRLGDAAALHRLHDAAILDGNLVYARAVEHVLALVDPEVELHAPPPLASQRQAPDLVASLLYRSVADSPVHEALAIVLDTGLYRRDVAHYQLTGVARVQPGATTVLGDVFGTVSRFLGQARTALFHQRSAGAPSAQIALLSPPAIVLAGDIREETPELRYLLGASVTGALAEHALVNALDEEALRTLIDALLAAFGPVANLPRGNAAVARLGQNLWQLVPPRADRRLRELCGAPISYDGAVNGTRQAMRRAGLFAAGGLAIALPLVAFELGLPPEPEDSPRWLNNLCEAQPAVADLVRLAIRTEFAEARWQQAAPTDRRRDGTGPRSRVGA
jgi:tetratricopeptide (TPR) repeat protein